MTKPPPRPLPAARRWCEDETIRMFDLQAAGTRARDRRRGDAADAGACLAAAGGAARHDRYRQAREPHADRRLQGARRAGLCRPPEARAAANRRVDLGDARQSRPEPRLRGAPLRRAGDDLCSARQFGREKPRDAGVRRRACRTRRGFPGRARGSRAPRQSATDWNSCRRSIPISCWGLRPTRSNCCARRPTSMCSMCRSGRAPASAAASWRAICLGLKTEIVGVQSTEAPSYALSFAAGTVVTTNSSNTLADGMATRSPMPMRWRSSARALRASCRSRDDEIAAAIRAYWTDTHNLAEGAGAAALAAALQEKQKLRGKRVGLILSGGNIDFDLFHRWVVAESPSWPAARRWRDDGSKRATLTVSCAGLDPRIHQTS